MPDKAPRIEVQGEWALFHHDEEAQKKSGPRGTITYIVRYTPCLQNETNFNPL
jgi:hypothetical protein